MKKLFLLIAAIAFAMMGCTKQESVPAKTLRIGVSVPSADHGWTGGIVWWAEKTAKEMMADDKQLKITVVTAKDAGEQVNQIENLMVQGIDALVLLPHEPGPLTKISEEATSKGIFLTVVDRNLDRPVQNLSVVGDNPGFGRACGIELVKQLGGKGDIVIMEGIPCQVNTDRVEAFKAEIAKAPGIKILDSQPAYWDTEKALKLMENFLQKHSKIDAVWTGDDDVLIGALKAYEESGRKDIKFFIGGAGSKVIVKKVLDKDPLVPFDVTYPPRMIAVGIEKTISALRKELPTDMKHHVVPAEVIVPDNAKEFYFPDSVY
ncbi:MAG: substrate-binding domain-containing protein [Victivallales bacterium]|nr:substrate-binding domain-containing protein [Victivallales bacterium]